MGAWSSIVLAHLHEWFFIKSFVTEFRVAIHLHEKIYSKSADRINLLLDTAARMYRQEAQAILLLDTTSEWKARKPKHMSINTLETNCWTLLSECTARKPKHMSINTLDKNCWTLLSECTARKPKQQGGQEAAPIATTNQ